jgi:TonB family protein
VSETSPGIEEDVEEGEQPRLSRAAVAVGAVLLVLVGAGVAWATSTQKAPPPPRKVMQFTMVRVNPPAPEKAPTPPPPVDQPKAQDEPQPNRVEFKPIDLVNPETPRPSEAPSGGPLALAAEGEGPGDAFNLVGNPGGKGLLSGGGLGDGTGTGLGGDDDPNRRFGWYYGRIAAEVEEVFRRQKALKVASARVELRIWADATGRIEKVQLIRSTGQPELDQAIQSVVGLSLRDPPPADIPMPMIARFTARRPQ